MKNAVLILITMLGASCQAQIEKENAMETNLNLTENEWREKLTPEQYFVLRQKGTERPFTGTYNMHFEKGTYHCAGCNAPLFSSDAKFDSHCGWPSFDKALSDSTVVEILDKSHGMIRTEIVCSNCGGHLGHVFNDGPTETGMRYCINSVSIDFENDTTK